MSNLTQHREGRLIGAHQNIGRGKPWRSEIYKDGTSQFLGYFNMEEEAHDAYIKARGDV